MESVYDEKSQTLTTYGELALPFQAYSKPVCMYGPGTMAWLHINFEQFGALYGKDTIPTDEYNMLLPTPPKIQFMN